MIANRWDLIPWWVVLTVLCAAPPLGAVLLLVKISSFLVRRRYSLNPADTNDREKMNIAVPVRKRPEHLSKILHTIASLYFSGAAYLFCKGLIAGADGSLDYGITVQYFLLCGCIGYVCACVCFLRERIVGACRDGEGRCPVRVIPASEGAGDYVRAVTGSVTWDMPVIPTSVGCEEYDAVLQKFNVIARAFRKEEMVYRVRHLGCITGQIFTVAHRMPGVKRELRRFESYYLPTVLKLLESYCMLERTGGRGQNTETAKQAVEGKLEEWERGFEEQLDRVCRFARDDIAVETEVLSGMMERDGLKGNTDFPYTSLVKKNINKQ